MLLLYFSFLGTGLETLVKIGSSPFAPNITIAEHHFSWSKVIFGQNESLIPCGHAGEEMVRAGYNSGIHPVEKTDLPLRFFYRYSAIPSLGFEDDRICEPVNLEVDHE